MLKTVLPVLKSVLVGAIISIVILALIPDLRKGAGFPDNILTTSNNSPQKLTFNQAVNAAGPAVVNVYSESLESTNYYQRRPVQRTNLGSGVIMRDDGFILTCLHVIANAVTAKDNVINVGLQDGRIAEAQIVGFDALTDLAVLKINEDNLPTVPQQENQSSLVGDIVLAIGNPYNLGQAVTQGIVSRISNNGLNNYFDYIQTDTVLKEGNSGGALVDSQGNLVGITSANFRTRVNNRIESVDDVSFAIPYRLAKQVMEEIINNGKVTRGALGFSGEQTFAGPDRGIYVTGVARGGPAERGGLRANDIILSIDDIPATGVRQALDYITQTAPGSVIKVEVARGGEKLMLTMQVAELNA